MTTARAQAWDADVIIVGGGMVGLALAAALKNTPFSVLVMERAFAEPRLSLGRDMRVSALVAGTANMLAGIGVWPYLEHQAGPIRAMRVWDDQEDGGIRFEAGEIGEEALGYIVENSVLVEALHRTLADAENVHLECPVEVAGANWLEDHAELKLADGRVLRTPLLVGADGGRSWLREQASIHEYGHPYHQKGIVATVKTRLPHRQTAYQRFMPTGPLAFLPLTDNLISIVWSAEDHEAERLMALSEKQFADELYLAFGPLLGDIEAVGERGAFPPSAGGAGCESRPARRDGARTAADGRPPLRRGLGTDGCAVTLHEAAHARHPLRDGGDGRLPLPLHQPAAGVGQAARPGHAAGRQQRAAEADADAQLDGTHAAGSETNQLVSALHVRQRDSYPGTAGSQPDCRRRGG